jgi:hypothetical protein
LARNTRQRVLQSLGLMGQDLVLSNLPAILDYIHQLLHQRLDGKSKTQVLSQSWYARLRRKAVAQLSNARNFLLLCGLFELIHPATPVIRYLLKLKAHSHGVHLWYET